MNHQQNAKSYTDDWDEPQPEPMLCAQPVGAICPPVQPPLRMLPPAHAPALLPTSVRAPLPQVAIPLAREIGRFPGLFARSAIFGVGQVGAEPDMLGSELACYGEGYCVIYDGPRLGMRDKRVWEIALRAAKAEGFAGGEIALSASDIAKELGISDSGPDLTRVAESLKRLARAKIAYRVPGATGIANMLGSARKASSGWRISIDPGLVPALDWDGQFLMNTIRRERLSSDLARWLHDFVSTHAAGFQAGFKLSELADLCAWRAQRRRFPAALEQALAELSMKCPELVVGFEIQRKKRSSESWRARVDRGLEKESFRTPAKERRPRAIEKPRRGGVSL